MISRGPFRLQPLCDSDLESMVGLSYAFAHPLEKLRGSEWQKWVKHIEWKQMKPKESGSKQAKGGKPSYASRHRLNLLSKHIVDARNLHEFKGRLKWFLEDKVPEDCKMHRKDIQLRRSLFWKLDAGEILRRITLYMKLVLWLSPWLMVTAGDKILG